MIKPRIAMTIRHQKCWCDEGADVADSESPKAWVVVDAETTANGKTWVVKAAKKNGDRQWRRFSVAEKQIGASLDPRSELFSSIQEKITREYKVQTEASTGANSVPFSMETRAFLSSLLSNLNAIKEARVQDSYTAETPTARLIAVLGAEAIEDVIRMIRENYQSCIDTPAILDAAIAARVLQEGQGITEL